VLLSLMIRLSLEWNGVSRVLRKLTIFVENLFSYVGEVIHNFSRKVLR
jgi:hypothetical protein